MNKRIKAFLPTSILLCFLASCARVGETQRETQSVQPGGAESVEATVKMGAGELRIEGGAESLLDASFTYNIRRWKPIVDYRVSGNKGILDVRHRRRPGIHFGRTENEWDLRFNKAIPLELNVTLGAGENRLDLEGMNLKALNIRVGVGEMRLNLKGPRTEDLDVVIKGGIGEAVIVVPREVGVKAEVDRGIGSISAAGFGKERHTYTNAAFGKTEHAITMSIKAGIGSITLRED